MKLLTVIFFGCFLLCYSFSAEARVREGSQISAVTLAPLAAWVEKTSNVSLPFLPVAVASDTKLEKALHLEDAQHAGAMGAYLPGRIILSHTMWEPESPLAQSYLIHELVHHAQFVSGRIYPCHAAREREAYTLQNQWLREQGLKPIVTDSFIHKMAACANSNRLQSP